MNNDALRNGFQFRNDMCSLDDGGSNGGGNGGVYLWMCIAHTDLFVYLYDLCDIICCISTIFALSPAALALHLCFIV